MECSLTEGRTGVPISVVVGCGETWEVENLAVTLGVLLGLGLMVVGLVLVELAEVDCLPGKLVETFDGEPTTDITGRLGEVWLFFGSCRSA